MITCCVIPSLVFSNVISDAFIDDLLVEVYWKINLVTAPKSISKQALNLTVDLNSGLVLKKIMYFLKREH